LRGGGYNDAAPTALKQNRCKSQLVRVPARNTPTCPAVVPLCGTKAKVTVPSLDDWEKDWRENPQRSAQPKLLPVDLRSSLAAIAQSN
jgi:hypothetical protein